MAEPKIYCGNGKERVFQDGGSIIGISICLEDIPQQFMKKSEKNGKTYVNLDVLRKREIDQYGKTHSVTVNTYVPSQQGQQQQGGYQGQQQMQQSQQGYQGAQQPVNQAPAPPAPNFNNNQQQMQQQGQQQQQMPQNGLSPAPAPPQTQQQTGDANVPF